MSIDMIREAQWRLTERKDPKGKVYYSGSLARKEADEYVERMKNEYDVKEVIEENDRIRIIYDDKI